MKKLTSLGCLLALVFAGATAQAKEWFDNRVLETPPTGWKLGGTVVDSWGDKWVSGHIEFTDWNNALTYAPDSSEFQVTKDTAVSTKVKFSPMDYEDLIGNEDVDILNAKAGLTVAKPEGGGAAYYGIVNGAWVALEGPSPTEDAYVDVKVELFKKNGTTYVNYTIGTDPAVTLTYGDETDLLVAGANVSATIASVEYLGQCNIKTLAGDAWSNPCTITLPTLPTGIAGYTAFDENGNVVNLNSVARGTVLHFDDFKTTTDETKYYTAKLTGTTLEVDDDTNVQSWSTYVTVTEKTKEQGKDYPSSITVDDEIIKERIKAGALGGEDYLYTQQSNGQLGWVNYSLGIADNATIAPTNAPQTDAAAVIVNFGIDVDDNANVKYLVGGVKVDTPDITIAASKGDNQKVVDVTLVLMDEGNAEHQIKTVSVGVMETGKQGPTTGKTFDIVAVPWDSMGGGDVTVNNLLNTAYLKNGDTLYIWNQTAGLYDTYVWTVPQEGVPYWNPDTQTIRDSSTGTSAKTSENPATKKIAKNTAIWIERDTTSRIVFAGIVTDKTAKYTATVAAGGAAAATWSLIANPSIKTFNLNDIPVADHDALPEKQGVEVGDMIIVEDVADPREYTYENGVWGYMKKMGFVEKQGPRGTIRIPTIERCTDAVIPAGVGFWYVRAAKQPEFTITFGDNDVSNKE